MENKLDIYRSLCAQALHKEGITNFQIIVEEPSDPMHQCQLVIIDKENKAEFMLIVVRGEEDIKALMPSLSAKLKELRSKHVA